MMHGTIRLCGRTMPPSRERGSSRLRRRSTSRCRTGFLYVAVLFTSLVVMAAVTAALSISTSALRSENNRTGQQDALWLAESEVGRQLAIINRSNAWRADHTSGTFIEWHTLTFDTQAMAADAAVRHMFTDSDGDLEDDDFDPVSLTVHARVGDSHAAVTVELEPDPQPLDLLEYAITAGDDLQFDSAGTVVTERPVQVFDDARGNSNAWLVTPTLECGGNVDITLRGELRGSSITLPTRDVVATYVSIGTEIPQTSLPEIGGDVTISNCVLTATDNPYGPTDAAGIYWIDADGKSMVIRDCRIEATLAITNCSSIVIRGGVVWHYPTDADVILATNTRVEFSDVEPELSESIIGVNFNPPSSPYPGTEADVTLVDVFPTELRGIFYTSGDMRFYPRTDGGEIRVTGALIGRDLQFDGPLVIHSLDEVLQSPPRGLSDPTPMRILRGTYRRIPTP